MTSAAIPTIAARTVPAPRGELRVRIDNALNDYGLPLRWMVTWLFAESEGAIAGQGRGGDELALVAPPDALGYRLRRWTSDGIAPEYEDTLFGPA